MTSLHPSPPMSEEQSGSDNTDTQSRKFSWEVASQVAIVGLFAIAVLVMLYLTRALTVPVVLAVTIGTILAPSVSYLKRRGIPRVLSTIVIVLFLCVLFVSLAVTLTTPFADWLGRASEFGTILRSKLQSFSQPISALQDLYAALQNIGRDDGAGAIQPIEVQPSGDTTIVEAALGVLTPALSQLLIFFVSLIFYLIYKDEFKNFVTMTFSTRKSRLRILRIFNDVEAKLARYFSTFSLINIGLAAVCTLAMYLIGMPNPLLWGVLAGLFNYLPYLGPAIVTISLVVASILTFPTLTQAMVPPLVYMVIHVLEGEFLTPMILGYSLSVNPFFLFLAVVFWTWMWGPIGAFLAVPIAMITVGVAQHVRAPQEMPNLPK